MCANFGFAALGARIALMIGSDREAPGAARRAEGGEVTLLLDGAVKRIALARHAAERANEALHFASRHPPSVTRTRPTSRLPLPTPPPRLLTPPPPPPPP